MSSHEGRLDTGGNQLELWAEPDAPPMLGLRVLRRDGREAAFDLSALADSIRRAGWPGEALDADTARSFASAVRLYLQQSPQPIAIDTVRQTVERLLIDMGYTLSARMYAGAFAPATDGAVTTASAGGMFDEPLPLDRAERFLAAAAADAGLERAEADDLLVHLLKQIRAAGVEHLTPGLLREWMRSELHTRGLTDAAGRLARLSLPVNALHDAFIENDRPPSMTPADPESAALALAQRVSGAYVLGQLLPSIAGQAHLRGDIQVRGIGNFLRLDSARLCTQRLAISGATPEHAVAQLISHTDGLSRFFGGELSWPAINFGLASAAGGMAESELHSFVRSLLSATTLHAARPTERAAMQLGFAWDKPASVVAADENRESTEDIYSSARRLFVAGLEALAEMQGNRGATPAIAIHLSPYFFGAPEVDRLLGLLGRIATGVWPISLHYDAATPELFDGFEAEPAEVVVAQTVTVPVARLARVSTDLNDFLTRLETRVEAAAAAHCAKHDFLRRAYAERSGPLTALRTGNGGAAMADPRHMHYRIALKDASVAALERVGAPWIELDSALGVAEAALTHLRDACTRHSAAANLRFTLAEATATRPIARLLERAASRHETHAIKSINVESLLHPHYNEAPFFTVNAESFASSREAAAFIRQAFLHTSCRALRIL